ncbi:MAG: hypothetical protein V3T83_12565 [Acidobacteriota bacterium]
MGAKRAERLTRTFCHTLHTTGCRITEALRLLPQRVDLAGQVVVFETLKKRPRGVFRAVPVPPGYLDRRPGHGSRAQAAFRGRSAPSPWTLVAHDRLAQSGGRYERRRHRGRPAQVPEGAACATPTAWPPS